MVDIANESSTVLETDGARGIAGHARPEGQVIHESKRVSDSLKGRQVADSTGQGIRKGIDKRHSAETLEAKYREYAEASTAAILRGDAKTANRNFDKLVAIAPKLKALGTQGEAILRRLMKDPSDAVATSAAFHCLPFAEAEALEVLDVITGKGGWSALMHGWLPRSGEQEGLGIASGIRRALGQKHVDRDDCGVCAGVGASCSTRCSAGMQLCTAGKV